MSTSHLEFKELIRTAVEQPMKGWDFTYVEGRIKGQSLPWDYTREIIPHLTVASSMLDMGTGGGEFLSSLPPLPQDTCATESYPPNIPIAQKQLNPLGVQVFDVTSDDELPFADERFDLIINRHESYSPAEVFRILRHGGRFITQQVGGTDNHDLNHVLHADVNPDFADWNLKTATEQFVQAGFRIVKSLEAFPETTFSDINAVVFYLRMIPWQIPHFTVEKYLPSLRDLHERILEDGPLVSREHRFFVEVTKA